MRIIKISHLFDIFAGTEPDGGDLYIDIDKTCLTPERLIARAFSGNYALRNRIMANTKKTSFDYASDSLIPTRDNLEAFLARCRDNFRYVAYVTTRSADEVARIRRELGLHHLPTDLDILHRDDLRRMMEGGEGKPRGTMTYYLDSDPEAYQSLSGNKSQKSVLFQLSPF